MKCKHRKWLDTVTVGGWGIRVCSSCGERIGMGPSNDTPEALVELRAAELAVRDDFEDGCERCGSACAMEGAIDAPRLACRRLDRAGFDAGYLAVAIVRHDWTHSAITTHPAGTEEAE